VRVASPKSSHPRFRSSCHPTEKRRKKSVLPVCDRQFIEDFETLVLPADKFHHEDHVRLAFLYLRQLPTLEAVKRFATSLQRFAAHHGKTRLYHETITWAFLFLIRERMQRNRTLRTWRIFAEANPDLVHSGKDLLKKYYREETLSSDLARTTFLFPDRI